MSDDNPAETAHERTIVAPDSSWTWVWVGFPLVGAAAGWLLAALAEWATSLPWAPLRGPFKLLTAIPEPYGTVVAVVVGAVAGLVVALMAAHDSITLAVSDAEVTIARGDSTQTVDRSDVAAVFPDGKRRLVVLGHDTSELASQAGDVDVARSRAALLAHGYPWHDSDPHAEAYQRWVPGLPELSPGIDALFTARGKALDKKDADDVTELRAELAKHGLVVREEGAKQYWRRVAES